MRGDGAEVRGDQGRSGEIRGYQGRERGNLSLGRGSTLGGSLRRGNGGEGEKEWEGCMPMPCKPA
jgi:hypothetical protein